MNKKCLNGARMYSKITEENFSYRAPILRMEDILEMDAISTEEGPSSKRTRDSGTVDDNADNIYSDVVSSLNFGKVNYLERKKMKRKRIFVDGGTGAKGYDSFPSEEEEEEDKSEPECAGGLGKNLSRLNSSDGGKDDDVTAKRSGEIFVSSDHVKFVEDRVVVVESSWRFGDGGKYHQSKPRKMYKRKKKCATCYLEKKARERRKSSSFSTQESSSECKFYDGDPSNPDPNDKCYYANPSEIVVVKTRSSSTTSSSTGVQKMCNCYGAEYFSRTSGGARSHHRLSETVHSR